MNYLKIYTLLLCAVLIAACSDDEEQFNSGGYGKLAGNCNDGERICRFVYCACCCDGRTYRNYPCDVRIKDHNAKEDENYIVTTKTLLIPAGQNNEF